MSEKKRNALVNGYFAFIVVALVGVLIFCTLTI